MRGLLERVRAHRVKRNWSQVELARRAGISVQSHQNFETGHGNITLAHLLRILGVLGLASRFGRGTSTSALIHGTELRRVIYRQKCRRRAMR